jgi:hypothetical protein
MPALAKPRRAKGAAKSPAVDKPAASGDKPAAARDPAEFARQQAERLEAMLKGLFDKADKGELGAIDRILKILDRLDRYQGFSPAAAPEELAENARERILRILSDVDARRAAAAQEEQGEGANDAPADA